MFRDFRAGLDDVSYQQLYSGFHFGGFNLSGITSGYAIVSDVSGFGTWQPVTIAGGGLPSSGVISSNLLTDYLWARWIWVAPVQSGGITTSAGGLHLNGMSGLRITGHVHPSTSGATDSDNTFRMGGSGARWSEVWGYGGNFVSGVSGFTASFNHLYIDPVESGKITTLAGGLHIAPLSGIRLTGHIAPSNSGATNADNTYDLAIALAKWRKIYTTDIRISGATSGQVLTANESGDGTWQLSPALTLPSSGVIASSLLVERVYSRWLYAFAVQSGGITTSAGGLHLNGLSGLRITGHVAPSTSGATDLDNDRDMGISTARWRNTWSMGGIFDSGVSGSNVTWGGAVGGYTERSGIYTLANTDYYIELPGQTSSVITLPSSGVPNGRTIWFRLLNGENSATSGRTRIVVDSGHSIEFTSGTTAATGPATSSITIINESPKICLIRNNTAATVNGITWVTMYATAASGSIASP